MSRYFLTDHIWLLCHHGLRLGLNREVSSVQPPAPVHRCSTPRQLLLLLLLL